MEATHPPTQAPDPLPQRQGLYRLKAELADLAFVLERQRRHDALEVAHLLLGRIDEIIAEPMSGGGPVVR